MSSPPPKPGSRFDAEILGAIEAIKAGARETEGKSLEDSLFEHLVEKLLELMGEDPTREGLRETPERVRKAWREWLSGYRVDPRDVLKSFTDGAPLPEHSEMVLVKDIPVYSHCEHHLAPFFGVAHIAYIPNGRVVGLSKLPRMVDVFARRLQVQECMTQQIADAIDAWLAPQGVAVMLKCQHLCMASRGVRCVGSNTVTSTYRGQLKTDPMRRSEFLAQVHAQ